jgi:ABC-2 type transport system permease protein
MPIFQSIAFAGTFFAITKVPGFPTDRSINWYMPLAVCMGSAFGGVGLGFSAIKDIENGFFDRLRMAPTPRRALIIGPLISCWVRTLVVVTIVLLVSFCFGARLTSGFVGLATLYVSAIGLSTVAAGWGLGIAFRFRDMRGAAIMQLTLFLTLFLSSAQTPLNMMTGWLHTVARYNPATNILRLSRQGFLGDVTWDGVWGGLVALVGLSVLTLWFARRGLDLLDR